MQQSYDEKKKSITIFRLRQHVYGDYDSQHVLMALIYIQFGRDQFNRDLDLLYQDLIKIQDPIDPYSGLDVDLNCSRDVQYIQIQI